MTPTDPKPNARSASKGGAGSRTTSGHGGTRGGAGRKALPGSPHKVRRALLSDAHVTVAKAAGGGKNMSAGIRKALDGHREPVALFTTPSWSELLRLFEAHGMDDHEMRCQKVDGVWHGQVYEVKA